MVKFLKAGFMGVTKSGKMLYISIADQGKYYYLRVRDMFDLIANKRKTINVYVVEKER